VPKWGLTPVQRATKPWGLEETDLRPAKTITDPVHGDIYVTELERKILDSRPMQRLRRVRQLGTAHLVYPGGTHSRFSHALGTLRTAQDLMDAVVDALSGPRAPARHLFGQWQREGAARVHGKTLSFQAFDYKLAEATVLARLGALLHDLGHVPLGHTIEDDLKVLEPHDSNVPRFEKLWRQLPSDVVTEIGDGELYRELRALILSKEEHRPPFESKYPFVGDIVGNTICADLIDYIERDHYNTGLPLAIGNRFVNDFYVLDSHHVHWPQRMVVRISRQGHLRADVVSELVKYLRYRYELSERVLFHHAKTAADAMIGKLLEMYHDSLWVEHARQTVPNADPAGDGEDIAQLRAEVTRSRGEQVAKEIDQAVRAHLEEDFLSWSDDGLLEHLRSRSMDRVQNGATGARRQLGITQLARMVLDRQLFKIVGRADSEADQALAVSTYKKFGGADARRKLEEDAASFGSVSPRWRIVLWIPNPGMRMKVADVLVDLDGKVAKLSDMPNTSRESRAIVERRERLWGVGIYVHPEVQQSEWRVRAVLAWLRDQTDLVFLDESGEPAPTVDDLIAQTVADELTLTSKQRDRVRDLVSASGMGGGEAFLHIIARTVEAAKTEGIIAQHGEFPFDRYL
jgi:HD superfamily phosphohydrolase